MRNEDDEQKKKKPYQLGQNIDDLSVEDLQELIGDLENEMARLETEIRMKGASISAANALLKAEHNNFEEMAGANHKLTLIRY